MSGTRNETLQVYRHNKTYYMRLIVAEDSVVVTFHLGTLAHGKRSQQILQARKHWTASLNSHNTKICPCKSVVHLWSWLSWRGKSKLPNEDPLEHCVKQWGIKGRFPSFPLQRGSTACRTCAVIQHTVAVPVPRFQVWGSNPSQGNFLWCDSNDNPY